MTELEYVISNFEKKFRDYIGQRIVLHGSRNYARSIIENYDSQYHFIGIMSREPLDRTDFFGLQILREDDIPQLEVDLIILTERVKYAEEVYQSIFGICKSRNIRLYDMYGLDEIELHQQIESCSPNRANQWKTICDPYDMVAFEVMDTLLYDQQYTNRTVVRNSFRILIPWLLEHGKKVKFSLRKSEPEEPQIAKLKSIDLVPNVDDCIIHRTGEDLSFRALREEYPDEKILYIGTGLVNECILPRYYGIDTYRYIMAFSCLVPVGDLEQPYIPYDKEYPETIRRWIQENDTISFDVYDTLLMRRTLFPRDVFELVEQKGIEMGYSLEGFARERVAAESKEEYADLDRIYKLLKDHYSWNETITRQIYNLELEIECSVTVLREEVVDLLNYAVEIGKQVVLTSDMYIPEKAMRRILDKYGICGYDKLLISCEYKRSKETGLYAEILNYAGERRKVLHIGDHPLADGDCCEEYGIKSVLIPSAFALSKEHGWAGSVKAAKTLSERCLVGMAISELFRNPFQNPNVREKNLKERLHRFAVGVVAPLIIGHTSWLAGKLRMAQYDGVMFLSRDGYLPMLVYQKLSLSLDLPPAFYFYSNRRAAFFGCADDENYIEMINDQGNYYHYTDWEKLRILYGLKAKEILQQRDGETDVDYIRRHLPRFCKVAEETRTGYLNYIQHCNMRNEGRYAVVDMIATGTTQYFLSRYLPFEMDGFYYGNYKDDSICPGVEDYLDCNNQALLENYMELECYFTSPEPSIDHISRQGDIVFSQEIRTNEEIQHIKYVHQIAEYFANYYFKLFFKEGEIINSCVPEEMFAAEGCHWVSFGVYDDWAKSEIATKDWSSA